MHRPIWSRELIAQLAFGDVCHCRGAEPFPQLLGMTAKEFEERIIHWANGRSDVVALILAGSRARLGRPVDDWADWDFHLLTSAPSRFYSTQWLEQIAPCWCAHAGITPRGVVKVSAIFSEGWEVDFVPLAGWQMRLVYLAMRHPNWEHWMPARLRNGIRETRGFMLGNGWRVLKGGRAWETRLGALDVAWPEIPMSARRFQELQDEFWTRAVWLMKKIARDEQRSAILWFGKLNLEVVYPLLQEEARLHGKQARPEARKAEHWLDATRLGQTRSAIGQERRQLACALLSLIELFVGVSRTLSAELHYTPSDFTEVQDWLRRELMTLTEG